MTGAPPVPQTPTGQEPPKSLLQLTIRRLLRRRNAWIGGLLIGAVVLGALGAPWLTPYNPESINLAAQLQPPTFEHPAGTDFFGRDTLSRLLFGSRATLGAAGIAITLAVMLGTVMGLIGGYSTGWGGQIVVAFIDLLLAFPTLLLAMMVVALLGPDLLTLAVAVGVAGIPRYARLVRSLALGMRSALYIEAARALGAGPGRILSRHLLPGVLAPVIALGTLDVGWAILSVAGLGFLGLGVAPPQAEWGLMLFEGRQYLGEAPWASAAPGLAITLTVLGATLLGDAISEATGPFTGFIMPGPKTRTALPVRVPARPESARLLTGDSSAAAEAGQPMKE